MLELLWTTYWWVESVAVGVGLILTCQCDVYVLKVGRCMVFNLQLIINTHLHNCR